MNKLSTNRRINVLRCLLEGMSIRGTSRITGTSKVTIMRLLGEVGHASAVFQKENMKNLDCKYVQIDELWAFIYSKKKPKYVYGIGEMWTWIAICAETKIVPTWLSADRSANSAHIFIKQLSECINHEVQITSDGLNAYQGAIAKYMENADFGMMIKHYIKRKTGNNLTIYKNSVQGMPDKDKISTCYIERLNLNIRMDIRRFTRKTNAFSKKKENHMHALAFYFYYYNFVRIHKTLKTTPANAMGISKELKLESVLDLIA